MPMSMILAGYGTFFIKLFTMKSTEEPWFEVVVGDREWKSLGRASHIIGHLKEI